MTPTIPEAAVQAMPCPRCASENVYIEPDERGSGGQWVCPIHIGCNDCGINLICNEAATVEDAVSHWNDRALPFLTGVNVAHGTGIGVLRVDDYGQFEEFECATDLKLPAGSYDLVIDLNEPSPRAQALDLRALENLSAKADEYDYADDIGPFPDIQDAMVSVGDLRAVRKLLPEIRALSQGTSSERAQALEEAARNACMYLETGFIVCPQCGEEVETKHTDAEYTLRSALSHPVSPDMGVERPVEGGVFQDRVKPWMVACFGEEISNDKLERCDRFIEEALELVQAIGYSADRAHALVDYVFNRDIGEPHQEVGGVMVTLAALCLASGLDMNKAGEDELARIWTKVEKIRAKQAAKPTGSALPIAHPQAPGVAV